MSALKTLGFTIGAPGGDVSTGFSDAAGADILRDYAHDGLEWVDVMSGKGYTADGPIDGDVGGVKPSAAAVGDGWSSIAPADGDAWFSYYPGSNALVVSMMAKYGDSGATAVDATAPTEVFRFHYGLKSGQNGLGLKEVFETDFTSGDFRLGDVRGSADGNSLMTGSTMHTLEKDAGLMSLELIPTIDTLGAVWGDADAEAVVHQADSDFTDKTGEGMEAFSVDTTHYNLYTLKGKTLKVSATSGFSADAFAWRQVAGK